MTRFEKFFTICILCALLLMMVALFREYVWMPRHNTYPHCGVVIEVNHESDIVAVADFNGNIWEFYGAEDWARGDVCAMLMDDMGTAEVTDDEIVSARYCGTAGN